MITLSLRPLAGIIFGGMAGREVRLRSEICIYAYHCCWSIREFSSGVQASG